MDIIQQTVRTEFRYPVHFTRQAFNVDNDIIRNLVATGTHRARLLFVIDAGVCEPHRLLQQIGKYSAAHHDSIESVAEPLVIPGGEAVKNCDEYVDLIRSSINKYGICRHSFVVAIGGGAVLDAAGYAAATSHRGVRLIRLPSTVLAQNDSGVGVKTSINRYGKKNFLGTFTPPFAVVNDFDFLESLSDRDWRSGSAEAVKVALIKDPAFFEWIEQSAAAAANRDAGVIEYLIYRCAQLHLQHIAGSDAFETGSSRPLDFGHWAAHKLEELSGYRLRHGEAVAVGIALDTTYSYLVGLLSRDSWRRILNVLQSLMLPIYVNELENHLLFNGLTEFREHLGGPLTILLLNDIAKPLQVHAIEQSVMSESIRRLRQYDSAALNSALCTF